MSKKKKIGLALGSGAFRGFAHLGVIQVLQENKIPISFVSGASIGSLVAAYYALNKDVENLKQVFLDSKKNFYRIADLGWRNGLVSGVKYERFIEHLLGNKNFSDTKIPVRVLATELSSADPYVFSKGKLSAAVRASSSVPVVFETTKNNLVDGALSEPVPVMALKEIGADKVIAISLYHKNEFIEKKFNLTTIALRSTRIALYNLSKHSVEAADLVINPDTSKQTKHAGIKKYFSKKLAEEMIEIGREATEEKIDEIKKWL